MTRLIKLSPVLFLLCVAPAFSQKKVKPDINESREFPGVFHSPSADATPKEFRSVVQMEVVVKKGDSDAEVKYTNGTVVSTDGLIVTVLDQPGVNGHVSGGIESACVLMLDGTGANATLVAFEPAYGVAVFRVKGVDMRPLVLSEAPPVANRRVNWRAVFHNGGKTYLYTRPLRVYQAAYQMSEREDLCQVIDLGTSSLNADRSGSALVSLDGTLLAIMGRQQHWNVTPNNSLPRKKLAWAVPSPVLARLLAEAEDIEQVASRPTLREPAAASRERAAGNREEKLREILSRQKGDRLKVYMNSRGSYVNGKSVSFDELSEIVRESGLEQAVLTAEPYVSRERITEVEAVIRKAGVEDIELAAPKAN